LLTATDYILNEERCMELLRRERLANGLILEFRDLSNRYFGDYHRLHIEVICRIPVDESLFPLPALPEVTIEQARQGSSAAT
jgi:hypothetical protein